MQHLDAPTRAHLRSTQILTSLAQLVAELVQNALDAGAARVDVGLDPAEWALWVRDDGRGMGREDMGALAEGLGGEGYVTSKAYDPVSLEGVTTFGFRGEALASVADLSCVEISSRTKQCSETWSTIVKGRKCLYDGPALRWNRNTSGTAVSVRDAFYNLPIRRLSHPLPAKTFEMVTKDLETISLVFPAVSFTLEDTRKSNEGRLDRARVLSIPKLPSSLAAFRHCYGRALAQNVDEISVSHDNEMHLEGFISLEGAVSKSHQFLYINRHPLAPCELHHIIDKLFNTSTFSKNALEEQGNTTLARSATRRSPRKSEKQPVYVLNLTLPPAHVDNVLEPAKATVNLRNHDVVVSFLSSVVQAFLTRHGFAHNRTHPQTPSSSRAPSPRKRQRTAAEPLSTSTSLPMSTSVGEHQCGSCTTNDLWINQDEDPDSAEVTWTDPKTGQIFIVDTRTGNSYPKHPNGRPDEQLFPEQLLPTRRQRLLPALLAQRPGTDQNDNGDMPDWIRKALEANQAYASTERVIRSSVQTPKQPTARRGHQAALDSPADAFAPSSQFTREDLANATVIGQVDKKFIACVIESTTDPPHEDSLDPSRPPSGKTSTLVVIDQHAADERVRVERYLQGVCMGFLGYAHGAGVKTRVLDPPEAVLLTMHELRPLRDSEDIQDAFARWGVTFGELCDTQGADLSADDDESVYAQVEVVTIPEVVADKLLSGEELRDLLKGYLATLEELGPPPALQPNKDPPQHTMWQKALRWCPRELLNLINSKACRGAIMFNDPLSREQCERLVQRVAQTSLPFQCAHGRPSMVPLTNLQEYGSAQRDAPAVVDWAKYGVQLDLTD